MNWFRSLGKEGVLLSEEYRGAKRVLWIRLGNGKILG